jgi:hypothetical protein
MTMNVEKSEVTRISRQPNPVQNVIYKNNWKVWIISTVWPAGFHVIEDVLITLNSGFP